jgi:DNA-binding MarR family transcriptional regulator
MGSDLEHLLHNCLYFTANTLARRVTVMAEEEFKATGLSPSHAFLLMLVNDQPGITQKELAGALHLAPSTVTRFVDAMQFKMGVVERKSEGKLARIFPTQKGQDMGGQIAACWKGLYERYSQVLGEDQGKELTETIDLASQKL